MPNRRRNLEVGSANAESGFTLIELLIVMSVILILITLAVPGYEAVHKKTNETSAMNSVRAIHSAETEYNSQYPSRGYACTLAQLGGKQGASVPTPDAAQLLAEDLAAGTKAGYNFTVKWTSTTASRSSPHPSPSPRPATAPSARMRAARSASTPREAPTAPNCCSSPRLLRPGRRLIPGDGRVACAQGG